MSSPEDITSLTIFILLFETSNDKYRSFRPTISFDSGYAWIWTILLSKTVEAIFKVVKLISPVV